MQAVVQYVLSGLAIGGIYALVALGFHIMWSAARAVNFAHGDTLMLGAVFTIMGMDAGLPLPASAVLAVAASCLFGVLLERFAVRPFAKTAASIGWMLTTIAVGIMLEALVTMRFGGFSRALPSPGVTHAVSILGAGVYTMPIWATLFAWPLLGTKPTLRGVVALILGMIGLIILFGAQGFVLDHEKQWGVLLALGSAVFFALGNVLNRSPIAVSPIELVAWQVGLGCLAMMFLGIVFEKPTIGAITSTGWTVLIYMTLIPTGLCYLTWFETLRRLPPAIASTGMLIVPLIGSISAAFLLGEPIGLREAMAMTFTLAGITLALKQT